MHSLNVLHGLFYLILTKRYEVSILFMIPIFQKWKLKKRRLDNLPKTSQLASSMSEIQYKVI